MANDPRAGPLAPAAAAAAATWHALAAHDVCAQFGVDAASGLSLAEAADRARRHGPNALREQAARSPWRMLLDQFTDFMILVLIAAAVISGVVGDAKDTVAIVVIVVLNAIIGFVQEFRAERAMAA